VTATASAATRATRASRAADGEPAPEDGRAALRVWLRLLACTGLVERELRGRLRAQFGSTLPRFDVLAQLDASARESASGLTMSELAQRLMVTNGNLTGLVERLVQERLVSRAASPVDGRAQVVRLTAAGKRALDAMTPEHHQWIDALFAGLSPQDTAQLYALLGKLRGSIRQSLSEDHAP
jgi:DNA-binding MarR family transcriptional regulator